MKFILLDHIKVQNANAIGGFTFGFPSVTQFLGFTHNLQRTIQKDKKFESIFLNGSAIFAHETQIKGDQNNGVTLFSQNKSQPSLAIAKSPEPALPPIVEEAKLNMTISLLIEYDGVVGNLEEELKQFIRQQVLRGRVAGGTVLAIQNIQFFNFDSSHDPQFFELKRKLRGVVLMDRSELLANHILNTKDTKTEIEAFFDFTSNFYNARPKMDLIGAHIRNSAKELIEEWEAHLSQKYSIGIIPISIVNHFKTTPLNKLCQKQWDSYLSPDEKTEADFEKVPNTHKGYLVPFSVGYKAIAEVHKAGTVKHVRDASTDVCFVETIHSICEWRSAYRIRTAEDIRKSIWKYDYQENWYLCKQSVTLAADENDEIQNILNELDF